MTPEKTPPLYVAELEKVEGTENTYFLRALDIGYDLTFIGRSDETPTQLIKRAIEEGFYAKVAEEQAAFREKRLLEKWGDRHIPGLGTIQANGGLVVNGTPGESQESLMARMDALVKLRDDEFKNATIIESKPQWISAEEALALQEASAEEHARSTRDVFAELLPNKGGFISGIIQDAKNGGKYSKADGVKDCMYGLRYVAMTPSKDGIITVGTPIMVEWRRSSSGLGGERETTYTLWGIGRVGNKRYKRQNNDVRHFKKYKDILNALDGVEVMLDKRFAREQIDLMLDGIAQLEKDYELL